jgi:hypothetical protein
VDDLRQRLERRIDDTKSSLEHRIDDEKDVLRAEMRALNTRMNMLENLIRGLIQQVSVERALRERVASLEARMPKQIAGAIARGSCSC